MNTARTQRGVALLIALLVVALATILIAGLLDRGELTAARARNQLREAQAQAYSQGLEAYAARVLAQSAMTDEPDSNASAWAVPLPPTPVPGGQILATMRDRSGCFNLNNLLEASGDASAKWQPIFDRLLRTLKLDPGLRQAVTDWMISATAMEDSFYLQSDPPYRAAKQAFVHVSELRLVKGVSAEVYAQLAPEVCVLPRGTSININTASMALLMSVSDSMDAQVAKSIWADGHARNSELPSNFPVDALNCFDAAHVPCFSVHSRFFLARGEITLDALVFTYYSLIERPLGNSSAYGIRVIERSRGVDM